MRVLDVGERFGMGVGSIFDPWQAQVIEPKTISECDDRIQAGDVDLVAFGGGEDISTDLYDHINTGRSYSAAPSHRDLFEASVFRSCVKNNMPILGICRGAQLACALSGGWLIQDVGGHGGQHMMKTHDGQEVPMTSAHHQMMYPFDIDHKLIAWVPPRSSRYIFDYRTAGMDLEKMTKVLSAAGEPEIVYFPKTKALAVQGHPEYYRDPTCPPVEYVRQLCVQFLGVNPS